ncbi:helix-turn-helix domain-containing protein [Candidatus Aalborgicola defluviihabitans]|uniref:AraC family transcriptional regulator n=1 Tax=Candidatus Aalborgicola defluviihabitans TaxID=3386187 RepID=UPI0039B9CA77
MPILQPKLEIPLSTRELPAPIMFRSAYVPAAGLYPEHQHAWGEFVYAFSGVMEVKVAGHHYLAPPQYGIWLPPDVEHVGLNRYEAHHCSLYLSPAACAALPRQPCALTVSPPCACLAGTPAANGCAPSLQCSARAPATSIGGPIGQRAQRWQLLAHFGRPATGAVLRMLEKQPGDNRSLPELAQAAHTTERTLMRRCQRDLGMSLADWRQRLRVVKAMPLLEAGQTVETIALDLGYGSASSFITMFKRLVGATPDEFRKGAAGRSVRPQL